MTNIYTQLDTKNFEIKILDNLIQCKQFNAIDLVFNKEIIIKILELISLKKSDLLITCWHYINDLNQESFNFLLNN